MNLLKKMNPTLIVINLNLELSKDYMERKKSKKTRGKKNNNNDNNPTDSTKHKNCSHICNHRWTPAYALYWTRTCTCTCTCTCTQHTNHTHLQKCTVTKARGKVSWKAKGNMPPWLKIITQCTHSTCMSYQPQVCVQHEKLERDYLEKQQTRPAPGENQRTRLRWEPPNEITLRFVVRVHLERRRTCLPWDCDQVQTDPMTRSA